MSLSSPRKRLQFSIRALLGLMSIVAVCVAAGSWWMRTSRLQQQAIDVIAAKGGFVWRDRADSHIDIEFGTPKHQGCGQTGLLASPRGAETTFGDEDLSTLRHIWRIRSISFANSRVSAKAIEEFRRSHPRLAVLN